MLNVLYVCMAITLLQGIQGFGGLGYELVNGDFVLKPHNSDLLAVETHVLRDEEHCDKVSATLQEMYKLGQNMTGWLADSGLVLAEEAQKFYKCSGPGVVLCIIKVFEETKKDLKNMKPALDEYRHKFHTLFVTLRREFPLCLH